jgi:hypothetical protein
MSKLLHERLGIQPGNWSVEKITLEQWGSTVILDCIHRYPPDEKPFRLVFEDCRSIQWYVQRRGAEMSIFTNTQMMSHDLGMGNYERTARFATTLVELIIAYDRLKIERQWLE